MIVAANAVSAVVVVFVIVFLDFFDMGRCSIEQREKFRPSIFCPSARSSLTPCHGLGQPAYIRLEGRGHKWMDGQTEFHPYAL